VDSFAGRGGVFYTFLLPFCPPLPACGRQGGGACKVGVDVLFLFPSGLPLPSPFTIKRIPKIAIEIILYP